MALFTYDGLIEDSDSGLLKAHIQVECGHTVSDDDKMAAFTKAVDDGAEGTIRIFFESSGKTWRWRG